MAKLEENGGVLGLGDKSSPDEIYATFQTSKGNFKKAIGGLLKQKKITIEPKRILQVRS
jgi:predicted RNA-binding protein (virulence factor B family)